MRCDSDIAATANGRSPRRRGEICRSFTCISPWFIVRRWFNGGKSRVSTTNFTDRNWGKGEIEGDLGLNTKLGKVSSSSNEDFSEIGKEASFNFGVGYGLIYLVRNELNKMVELRRRIESLLQQFQTEIQNQDDKHLYMPSRASICSSLTNIHVQEVLYAKEHDSGQCSSPIDVKQSEVGFRCDQFRRESSVRMDQLEAELEDELGRLKLREDGELLYPEVKVDQDAAELSLNVCYEKVYNDEFQGVSPRDLERKLHEVLEVRQQERIEELESALDYAMQQLEEKERDLSLWRDAARLVARQLPAISSMLVEVKQTMELEVEVIERGKSLVRNSV